MNREKLYKTAYDFLGQDASPLNRAPQDLACAESVNNVFKTAFGKEIGGDLSTAKMYNILLKDDRLENVVSPKYGDIIISPTGLTITPNGHVGIVGKYQIMSNNSNTGKWDNHFVLNQWIAKYGFVAYFRVKDPVIPVKDKEEEKTFLRTVIFYVQKVLELLQAKLASLGIMSR